MTGKWFNNESIQVGNNSWLRLQYDEEEQEIVSMYRTLSMAEKKIMKANLYGLAKKIIKQI